MTDSPARDLGFAKTIEKINNLLHNIFPYATGDDNFICWEVAKPGEKKNMSPQQTGKDFMSL